METNLVPISAKEFREVAKGCGIKYRNKIPRKNKKGCLAIVLWTRDGRSK